MNGTPSYWRETDRVSVSEVAAMAGVGPSAVSNWRKRHPDFPRPRGDSSAGSVTFQYGEILAWLRQHGKRHSVPSSKQAISFWKLASTVRGELRKDRLLEVLLQLLVLKRADSLGDDREPGSPLAAAWRDAVNGEIRPEEILSSVSAKVADRDPDLGRALRPQHGLQQLSEGQFGNLVRHIDQALGDKTDCGQVATSILREFNRKLGTRAEFSTHVALEDLMTGLLLPIEGSVLDPACGAAMLLARAWAERESDDIRLYGQEVAEGSWRLGYLHLHLQEADFELASGDTLRDDRFWSLKANRIAAHPPFGQRPPSDAFSGDDPRWVLGVPGRSTSDFAWTQHVLYHLADGGVGVTTTPGGNLEKESTKDLRAALVGTNVLDVVIQLPQGLSHLSSVAIALLLFQRGRSGRDDSVLFIDGRQLGTPRKRGMHHLPEPAAAKVLDAVRSWRRGNFVPEPRFSASATHDEIKRQDWHLGPGRYIRYTVTSTDVEKEEMIERWGSLSQELGRGFEDLQRASREFQALVQRVRKADGHD
ncbi:N-6 DNA methylase [Candidatus Palauibacter sp.]|uniref:N-6 DNA methylase n=1 Tax=Candidatus Palauibacter sp. TaxID=3101350 RepID=UPI003B5CED0E